MARRSAAISQRGSRTLSDSQQGVLKMDVKSFVEGGSPLERAHVGADRSAARISLLNHLIERVAHRVQPCQRCPRPAAHLYQAAGAAYVQTLCTEHRDAA